MARLLIEALRQVGHEVRGGIAAQGFLPEPSPSALAQLETAAEAEAARIGAQWRLGGSPDLWFSYHPYYKAPDLIGGALASRFGIATVTGEASYSQSATARVGQRAKPASSSLSNTRM